MLKAANSATTTGYIIEILHVASLAILLDRKQTTKVLIRLRLFEGWSAPLLFPPMQQQK